jgi:NADPH:quinone reductase-like Zn-dependent oxidoreductase
MMWPFKIAILGVVVNFVLMILMCGGPGEFYEVLQPLWLPTLDDGFKQFSKIQSASSGSTMFEGRTVLITGANRGYGKGAAENFLAAGATVIMACRSGIPSVGEQLVQKMKVDSGKVRMFKVDMGDVESVRNLVDALTAEKISLDIVVLNAALVDTASHKEKTNKGVGKIARMFQVNYLSNVVLLEELVDKNILDPKLLREKKPKVKALLLRCFYKQLS